MGLKNLLMQAFSEQWRDVMESYNEATSRPFGYLALDFHPSSDDNYRILSHLLKDEGYARAYPLKS